MIKFQRQEIILIELEKTGSVSLKELIQLTETPRLTIQRDLVELENEQKLKRVRGGAISINSSMQVAPRVERVKKLPKVKDLLARKAASFIGPNDTVCIDASTTCSFLAPYLPDANINVVTPSINTFMALNKKEHITPILTGGTYNPDTDTLMGNIAHETIRRFSYSVCFISAEGFDPERGSLDFDFGDNNLKNVMLEVSEMVYLLIDSSKFSVHKGILTCSLDRIDRLITDADENIFPGTNIKDKIIRVKE